ncbi:MAG: YdeI/OmpD-associated family protein [Gemmataceae bacterium]|nr:YdeI/OmpD-associated family protein [Gemmataceae bacterium]MCI0742834.1 YdeI/OmpD-associated family protein [Gemmataceae bacterium]
MKKSPEVDAYIAKAADFAKPILQKIRTLFHKACPDMEEEMKWSFPHFVYRGILGSMAAFKQHVSFGFWKGSLLSDPEGLFKKVGDTSMAGHKVTSVADLPADKVLLAYIKEAVQLNEEGVKAPASRKRPKKALEVPDYFLAALKKNKKALATFEKFSPSHKREYVEWVTEAKQEETRARRLAQAVEWMATGKSRHWQYQNC